MSADVQRRAEELFVELLGLSQEEQQRVVDARCADDPELRSEIESLLGHHHEAESFLDHREISRLAELEDVTLEPGQAIGEYIVHSLLGRGGMGVVYVAEQQRPKRIVAVKLVRRVLAGYAMLRRFEHEAEVLGRLRHPGIAQIYAAGVADGGFGPTPYIAMELVQGPSILGYASLHALSIPQRLELIIKVAHAVHHAHQRGIIHRDLKPANILVDETGQPKVLDFGVARATDADLQLTTIQTNVGQLVGTMAYMSPEQVLADPREVDTRTDIYALGVVLYQLLADRLPLDVGNLPLAEAARIVRDQQPPRLSSINRACRGELETIVAKALEKDKSRRYQSAQALADDLEAYLEGRPIAARQDSTWYVLRSAIRRHRGPVAAGSLILLAVIGFAFFAAWQANVQRTLAKQEREARLEADAARHTAAERAEELRRNLYVSAIGFAQAAIAANDMDRVRRVLASCPEDLRGWEWKYLDTIVDTSDLQVPIPGETNARAHAARDGSMVVAWGGRTSIDLHDPMTRRLHRSVELAEFGQHIVRCLMSDDGTVCFATTEKGWLIKIDTHTGVLTPLKLTDDGRCYIVDVSPDGRHALVIVTRALPPGAPAGAANEQAELFDLMTGETLRRFESPLPFSGALSPDGRFVALGLMHRIVVFDMQSDEPERYIPFHQFQVMDIAFSPDSRFLATAGFDGFVGVVNMADYSYNRIMLTDNKLWCVDWSPDSRYVASGGTNAVVYVVEPALDRHVRSLVGHATTIDTVRWTSRGFLISGSRDSTFRRWNNPQMPDKPVASVGRFVSAGCWSHDGKRFYLGIEDGRVMELDVNSWRFVRELTRRGTWIGEIMISRDGELLAVASDDGTAVTLDREGAVLMTYRAAQGRVTDVSFTSDGTRLAVGGDDEHVAIIHPRTGALLMRLPSFAEKPTRLAWAPDDSILAVNYGSRVIRIFDGKTYTLLETLEGIGNECSQLRFNHTGSHFLAACFDGTVYMWRTSDWTMLGTFEGHKGGVFSISLSPDGTRVITGGWDNTVRIWDFASQLELLTMRPHRSVVWVTEFSPDGQSIVTAGGDHEAKLWRATPLGLPPIPYGP
ncbi:MAG: protein kinase [Phycisphaeraceae bacterium]|nr:protein kinase [Phycisphaeraceae bacterium]MCW5753405.1 protein kinase [Phycisphaeraceae bacterium]